MVQISYKDRYNPSPFILIQCDNMKLTKIIHRSESGTTREIICTPFGSFYQTSGSSSPKQIKGTWMPFFYIQEKSLGKYMIRGDYSKFSCDVFEMRMHIDVAEKLINLFKNNKTTEIPARFATLECLLISSVLGGGLWDTKEGKQFKKYLQTHYAAFYQLNLAFEFSDEPPMQKKTPEEVNAWLMEQANVKTREALIALIPKDFNALIQAISAEQSTKSAPSLTIQFDTVKENKREAAPAQEEIKAPSSDDALKKRKIETKLS